MRILIIGRNGQVGWELQRALAPLGEVIALGRSDIDLAHPYFAAQAVRKLAPEIIINAAAYTAVDKAETETGLARTINALAPGAMAQVARDLGALFVHYSTDYVFDGRSAIPYREDDPAEPISAYGRSKEEGERLIRDSGARHLILRTSWVYGLRGKNFLLTMLKLAREQERLRIVADQFGTPTWCRLIAETTASLIIATDGKAVQETYHLTPSGDTSWHGFASAIIKWGTQSGFCPNVLIDGISTAEYPTAARRPAYSVLDTAKLRAAYGMVIPNWEEALAQCLAEFRLGDL